jgi:hypothetical protein
MAAGITDACALRAPCLCASVSVWQACGPLVGAVTGQSKEGNGERKGGKEGTTGVEGQKDRGACAVVHLAPRSARVGFPARVEEQ